MVRIKDVAEYGGISVASVSRYLNSPEKLKPETRMKIREAIEKLRYFPSPIARSLRTKCTETIALIIPSLANLYYIDLYSKLNKNSEDAGYTLNLMSTNHDTNILKRYLRDLRVQNIDGVIICYLDDDDVLDVIRETQKNIPLVLITSTPHREEFNSVFIDVMEGEVRATQHLIDSGCKHIAFVGGQMNNTTIEKKKGFETAMRKNGLTIEPELFFFAINHFTTGFSAVRHFLTLKKKLDGIVCSTDDIAIGCVKYLIRSGYKIPDDMKVIGHNGISLINAVEPSISSLSHPIKNISKEAMEMIFEQMKNVDAKRRQATFYTSLVVNLSTDRDAPVRFLIDENSF
jgi:DNA-binding LacI/PurR family transcriptional regulator